MKVFCTKKIAEEGLHLLREAGIEILQWDGKGILSPDELIHYSKQSDALLIANYNNIDAAFLNACRHLKVIAMHSVGYDNVDIKEASRLKIPVGNTPGVVSRATAETAFLLMLAVSRKAFYLHHKILDSAWKSFEPTADLGMEMRGKTLGIFGLGKIGYEMAMLCKDAFNMEIIYHNRHRAFEAEQSLGATFVSFEDLLKKSDVVSVHANLNGETKGKFNAAAFDRMKSSAIFINTGRGAIHDETALTHALQNGLIWGAGLDVTDPEPMQADNPLLRMPTVAVTPHIGTATRETRGAMATMAAQNVIAGLNGRRLPFAVNPEVYE